MALASQDRLKGPGGHYLTVGLFKEMYSKYPNARPCFTLTDEDKGKYIAIKPHYVASATEYEAAITILGSWTHWLRLKNCNWFKPYVEAWEAERTLREETEAKKILIEEAESGNVTAAKAIYDQGRATRRGRPSKLEKNKVLTKEQELDDFLSNAMGKVTSINKKKNK